MKKNTEDNKTADTDCKTTVLGTAEDGSFWDAETRVKKGDKIAATRIRVFSLCNLFRQAQQLCE